MKLKKIAGNILLGGITFMATIGVASCIIGNDDMDLAASSDDCIAYTDSDVKSYLNKTYQNIVDIYEITDSKYVIPTYLENYSQTDCNNYYNSNNNKKITGTCTIVACLGMTNYYGNLMKESPYYDDYRVAFSNIYNACLNEEYTTLTNGTKKRLVNDCLSTAFDTYNVDREGNTEWFYLEDKIKSNVEAGDPVIFDLTNHSTIALGYTSYYFTYKKTYTKGFGTRKRTVTTTLFGFENFIIVNEGWGRETKSLVPCNKIKNINDDMQICYAEK